MNVNEMIANTEALSESYDNFERYNGRADACGSWRSVALFEDYAVKSVQDRDDRDCQMEWDFYCATTDEVRALLAKPLYISRNGRSIAMERLEPLRTDADFALYNEAVRKLKKVLRSTYCLSISDDKASNFGKRKDGSIVWLDYGNLIFDLRDRVGDGSGLSKRTYNKMEHLPLLYLTPKPF